MSEEELEILRYVDCSSSEIEIVNKAVDTIEKLQKEIATQIAGQLNTANKAESKPEEKKEEEKPYLKVEVTMNDDHSGEIKTSINASTKDVFNMLVTMVADVFEKIEDFEFSAAMKLGAAISIECMEAVSRREKK